MNVLQLSLENCYGIGKFQHTFNFTESNSHLIYAPNGTMKSSFARTFSDIAKNDHKQKPKDRIYSQRKSSYVITADGSEITPEIILVVDAEDNTFDASHRISNFVASKELKKKYDEIYTELDLKKNEFLKKLKVVSSSSDCEVEFIGTFNTNSHNFFHSLEILAKDIEGEHKKYEFRYNDIFDRKGNVEKFLDKNQVLLDTYISNYKNLLSKSSFFKDSENSFGTVQANEILKSIEDNSFFEAGHKFVLEGNIEITSADNLKKLVEEEIQKIVNDAELKDTFEKVDKAIGANVELRAFKKAIEKENLLLVELQQYEEFKKKVWLSYFFQLKKDAVDLYGFYVAQKNAIEEIINEAKGEIAIWKDIISKFNSRFYVPFTVSLLNQEDIILKQDVANLNFHYEDRNEGAISQSKDNLLKILSKGEQRAYYILQLLFDIESRKTNEINLLVIDDIADSFDYKNKYAIIEYIKDLHSSPNFRIIILTHNFDFYRTISSRLNLGSSVSMAIKNEKAEISLVHGQYRKDVLIHFLSKFNQAKIFISLIAFVRNLVEYTEGDKCEKYSILTNCLHLKQGSINITANELLEIYQDKMSGCLGKEINFGDKKIVDLILDTAESIYQENPINEILLENKIVLAISIRLLAEQYMMQEMADIDLEAIDSNQTRILFEEFSKRNGGSEQVKILDRVILMTPENIHLNAFMYEPLIDMSLSHLKSLYKDVISLN